VKFECGSSCKKLASAIVVAVMVLALLGWQVFNHLTLTSAQVSTALGKPVPVSVQTVERSPIEQILGAEATAGESRLVTIRTSLNTATVSTAYVRLGDVVKYGQLLFRLDHGLQDITLATARNQLAVEKKDFAAAQQRLKTVEELNASGFASSDEVKVASKEFSDISKLLNDAEVKVQSALEDQKATSIISPVTGVVSDGELHDGMVVRSGTDLIKISDIDPIHVTVKLSEDKIKFAHIGQIAEVSFYAFPDRVFTGTVVIINPIVDDKTRLVSLVVRIDNHKLELMPGMNGVATIKSGREGLRIPAVSLVSSKDGAPYVFVVDKDNRARLRRVIVGAQAEGYAEVESGLTEGERVVVVGQIGISDNQEVRIGTEYAEHS
jgi:RND family efflux transporter MFP subunit